MFVDSRPTRGYGETPGWQLPITLTPETPHLSMELQDFNMDTSIPTFRSFVNHTPPLRTGSPRLGSADITRARSKQRSDSQSSEESNNSRRTCSSSIYSDQGSYKPQSEASWRSADLEDQQNIFLRPMAYDPSSSNFASRQSIPMILQPRTYSPFRAPNLASSPSPHLPDQEPRPSILLPPAPPQVQIPRKHLRTVSLEKTGGETSHKHEFHQLPEELRAQLLVRSVSHDQPATTSATLSANQWHHGHREPERFYSPSPREYVSPTLRAFPVGSSPARDMMPLAQSREQSRGKLARAFGFGTPDMQHARTRQPVPRSTDYSRCMQSPVRSLSRNASSEGIGISTQEASQRYPIVLNEGRRNGSNESRKAHRKLVPHALFGGKATPVTITSTGVTTHVRSSKALCDRWDDRNLFLDASRPGDGQTSFPNEPNSSVRRSTSGSIPISPPYPHPPSSGHFTAPDYSLPQSTLRNSWQDWTSDLPRDDHSMTVSRRVSQDNKTQTRLSAEQLYHMLPEDIIAEYLRTPEGSPRSSFQRTPSQRSGRSDSSASNYSLPEPKNDDRGHIVVDLRRFPERSRGARTEESSTMVGSISPTWNLPSPESPHLYPSPGSQQNKSPVGLHLGWSGRAKQSLDKARSSVRPKQREYEIEHITHDGKDVDRRPAPAVEPPQQQHRHSRPGSVLSGLIHVLRETKTERRRKEIRKMIRHVPNDGIASRQGRR